MEEAMERPETPEDIRVYAPKLAIPGLEERLTDAEPKYHFPRFKLKGITEGNRRAAFLACAKDSERQLCGEFTDGRYRKLGIKIQTPLCMHRYDLGLSDDDSLSVVQTESPQPDRYYIRLIPTDSWSNSYRTMGIVKDRKTTCQLTFLLNRGTSLYGLFIDYDPSEDRLRGFRMQNETNIKSIDREFSYLLK